MAVVTLAARASLRGLEACGRMALLVAHNMGAVALVFARATHRVSTGQLDGGELVRSLAAFGHGSVPVVVVTAAFVGMIMVLQAALYVRQYGIYDLVGWYVGFATLREVAPVLIGLVFSGRVGAQNASELAAMRVTEQLDALEVLGLDAYRVLVAPRLVAMVVAMVGLVVLGDMVAIAGGALCTQVLLGVDTSTFLQSLTNHLRPADFGLGVAKAAGYGAVVAAVSTHTGMVARRGSAGVGRAVSAQVAASALGIFAMDYGLTMLSAMGV